MDFRDRKKREFSKNGYFEVKKLASFAGWFQSRKSYLYFIANKVVGSQIKVRIRKGGER